MNVGYIAYDEVGITVGVIAIALAFIVLVWNAVKAIREWIAAVKKPTESKLTDMYDRLVKLEAWHEDVDRKLDSDYRFQQSSLERNMLMLGAIKQLLQHEINGNDTEGLSAMEKRIDNYLMEHQS